MKQLVIFCEGAGDEAGVTAIAKRLFTEKGYWSHAGLDPHPFRVDGAPSLFKDNFSKLIRLLKAARKRRDTSAVLLVLDGDDDKINREKFCARSHAQQLAIAARNAGAGTTFSFAVVFACREFESWLLAGIESLAGELINGRPGIPPDAILKFENVEISPRDAKGGLRRLITGGYNPVIDQGLLAQLVSFPEIRSRRIRSFQRLENAIEQLIFAVRDGQAVSTPCG